MRDTMVIYRSFYEAIKELDHEDQALVWNAVFQLGLNFEETELTGISKTIFTLIRPQIEANIRKYKLGLENGMKGKEYGKLGGRPKNETPSETLFETPKKPPRNPQKTLKKPTNDNVNDNVNVYRQFKHLSISENDMNKLLEQYEKTDIDNVLNDIENYAKNNQYTSLYLTTLKWLKRNNTPTKQQKNETGQDKYLDHLRKNGYNV